MTDSAQLLDAEDRARSEASAAISGMFGRDMVYLAFWGMQIILAAALTPATTRLMGKPAFGQAAAAIAVTQLLNCLFSFSLYTAVQRAYAGEDGENRARHLVALAIGLSIVLGAIAYATGRWWCPVVGLGPFPAAIRYAVLWAVMTAITAPAMGLVRSRDNLRGFVAASFTQSVVAQALALALVIFVSANAAEYILGQFVGELLTAAIALSVARPKLPSRTHAPALVDALRFSSALVPAAIASFVFDASDRIVIHGDLGAASVGRYAVARNIGGFALVLLQLVMFVWTPRLFAIKDPRIRRRVLATSRDGLYVLVVAFVIAIAAASPVILALWAPPSYDPHTLLLITALVAAGALPATGTMIYTQVLIINGRTRSVAATAVVIALLNLGLNLALVPVLGIDGSAGVTCFCFAIGAARSRWMAGSAAPPSNPSVLAFAALGMGVCIALAGAPTSGPALAGRMVIAAAAATVFLTQLGELMRPGFGQRLADQLRGRR